MSRSEFWESTPRQIAALRKVRREETKLAFLRTGIVAAAIASANGAKNVKPSDFVPGYEPTPQELEQKVAGIFGSMGAQING